MLFLDWMPRVGINSGTINTVGTMTRIEQFKALHTIDIHMGETR